jgi:hypothetical protein
MKTKKKTPPTGRRTKLTKATTAKLIEAIQAGCTYSLACQYAGITYRTFNNWMNDGMDKKTQSKIDFFHAIKKAEAQGAMTNLQMIQKAAMDDWRASAWVMERRHKYIKTNQIQVEETHEQDLNRTKTTKEILQEQQLELLKASKQALNIGSFQAYASLQRQVLSVTLQLQALDIDGDELEEQTDEELIMTITNIVKTLPPVLQQRIQNDIQDNKPKTVKIHD